ncbi:uncharacterized protein AFUA_3G08890 [Aspergillus fumigatus Af293]|uniref:Uncharacterized protein n=1 Tax=Aspergillus fumigatus (strain ATCC MYA-4609 / CBS 101355 / FGSC A1100 / Af293) TaxID=330879 RepID=Q4WXB4_ASPFU|nr:hypothetical protein AFUA_3G08890 [Aspergillus fumigatus Af293]EAL92689.1 hypothetical protein AFUA_3G08890 [Aspergillus fumigatus Af293]
MPANEQRSPESHEEFSHTSSTTTTRSSNSAASEDVYVEDVSSRDSGYDGDIEVVKPYAIEEPEDEAPRHVPRLAISPAPNDAESWQGELIILTCGAVRATGEEGRGKHPPLAQEIPCLVVDDRSMRQLSISSTKDLGRVQRDYDEEACASKKTKGLLSHHGARPKPIRLQALVSVLSPRMQAGQA